MKRKHCLRISIISFIISIILLFFLGCSKWFTQYENNDIQKQQFVVRNCIDNCKTFDCSLLEKEKLILFDMINKNENPVCQGVQQSIVTTITRKCYLLKGNDKNVECKCYTFEKEKLNGMIY